jgi:hypothetical protein
MRTVQSLNIKVLEIVYTQVVHSFGILDIFENYNSNIWDYIFVYF